MPGRDYARAYALLEQSLAGGGPWPRNEEQQESTRTDIATLGSRRHPKPIFDDTTYPESTLDPYYDKSRSRTPFSHGSEPGEYDDGTMRHDAAEYTLTSGNTTPSPSHLKAPEATRGKPRPSFMNSTSAISTVPSTFAESFTTAAEHIGTPQWSHVRTATPRDNHDATRQWVEHAPFGAVQPLLKDTFAPQTLYPQQSMSHDKKSTSELDDVAHSRESSTPINEYTNALGISHAGLRRMHKQEHLSSDPDSFETTPSPNSKRHARHESLPTSAPAKDNARHSIMSNGSTVIRAIVVDTEPVRHHGLRHVSKTESLRDAVSQQSSSRRTTPDSQHRLVHKRGRIPSKYSDNSVDSGIGSDVTPSTKNDIRALAPAAARDQSPLTRYVVEAADSLATTPLPTGTMNILRQVPDRWLDSLMPR
ncbi:hypothetical protein MRB53_037934 [Persea americana]|nr:hypothetical protein MRB53_037934 [Persea americana]